MKLLYTTGPKRVSMGKAGLFERGLAKKVAPKLAQALLNKRTLRFYEDGKVPAKALAALKKLAAAEARSSETQTTKTVAASNASGKEKTTSTQKEG
ncbi:MAG: hypothetical protein OET90_08710 [Desulfuromonadales bacterium]|nr:hypothetical protein [Desulfuromonadales bacterium]